MTRTELTTWIAFNRIWPFGEDVEDFRSAVIATTVAQANARKGKRFRLKDFIPFRRKDPLPQGPGHLVAQIKTAFKALGADIPPDGGD